MSVRLEQNELLARLAARWGLALQSSRRIRKIWRLQTERGAYCLKRSILDLRDLIFVQSATEHLLASGFTAILPYVPSLDGRESVEIGGEVFVLFPWLDSREADFDDPADLGLAVRVLADLHERSKGFIPFRSDPDRVRWGMWPQIMAARRHQLAEFGDRARALARGSAFCALFARLFPYYYAQANRAMEAASQMPYAELSRDGVRQRTICHHDFSARNLLIDGQGRPVLIDFDYCLADLRVHDLANLILRLLRHNHWRGEIAANVLRLYDACHPLDEREPMVLYTYLLWPQDFWQIGLQYFLEELPWSADRFADTLRRKTEDRAERAAFLEWYAEEYLGSRAKSGIPSSE